MTVSMSKAEGVTMLTLTTDPHSPWPPLCQIIKGLCYSPVCCSVSQHLKRLHRGSLSVLGAIQIMVGLLNIGLGAILSCSQVGSWWQMDENGFPYWMGGFFVWFGIVCILSERYPSPCLLILNAFLHLVGVGFAVAAIVLYSINIAHIAAWWMCRKDRYDWGEVTGKTVTEEEQLVMDRCEEGKVLLLNLLRGVNVVLIVLSILELSVVISCFVFTIKSLRNTQRGPNKTNEDPDSVQPLLEVAGTTPSV